MSESEIQAELERLRALRALRDNFRIDPIQQLRDRLSETNYPIPLGDLWQ
jgi:hypothetical protein